MSRTNPPPQIDDVKLIPHTWVESDGQHIVIEVELLNGKKFGLRLPYAQLDFTVQALLQNAIGAYERQVQLGTLPFEQNYISNPMMIESVRVMRAHDGTSLLIQCSGRTISNGPLGMGSFCVDEPQARDLGRQLIESADLMVRSRHPS